MNQATQRNSTDAEKSSEIDNRAADLDVPSWKFWKKRRYVVACLAFFGFFNVYALRVNLSIAIVAMTEEKIILTENGTTTYKEFDWDSEMQGWLLSSFFYGYIVTQLPGGWLAARIGGNKVFGVGIAATAFLTLITPFLAHTNVYLFLAVRVIEGIFEGVTYPCIHAVWARWAPPLERSRLATIAFSGSYVGTVVSMPVCGLLATYVGWESIFYVFGVIGLVWWVFWMLIVKESPSTDPHISKAELRYIKESLGDFADGNKNIKHPWKSILTSAPVWAIVASHFSENWGFYTLLTQLPKFMKDTLGFELTKTGFISAVPYLAMAIMIQFCGHFADWCQIKGYLTTTQVRKIFNCGAFVAQTVFMLGAAFLLSPVGSMVCLTLAVGLGAFAWCGFSVNHLDIAPQHASVLMGLSNTFATLPGILSPTISGYIVKTPTDEEWKIVFYIASSVYFIGCVIYGIFCSGELQPWAMESQPLNKTNKNENNIQGHDNATYESDNL
ncbi:Major Facilitator Superfamily Transporter 9 [Carabus blaptoides fortunei]